MRTITVNASKNYDIVIGDALLDEAGSYAEKAAGVGTAAVITDDNVDGLYGERLIKSLEKQGYSVVKYVISHGEASKNAENFVAILNFLAENRLTRTDTVFALGGGVVGDLAGFAAASYMRGIRFIQVSTTLLAAVDSSVGGKTAIDLKAGKNLAGAFYQPELVLCDYSLFSTLPDEVFRDGCAEVVKYGVLVGGGLFDMLKNPVSSNIEKIITRCVEIKRDIVNEDERESGLRKVLNLGHTVGHAIEKLSDYGVTHGHAVAAGMAVIARASARKGICNDDCRDAIIDLIKRHGLETTTEYDAGSLWRACLSDKKISGRSITLVVPEKIGACKLLDMPVEELEEFIRLGVGD